MDTSEEYSQPQLAEWAEHINNNTEQEYIDSFINDAERIKDKAKRVNDKKRNK